MKVYWNSRRKIWSVTDGHRVVFRSPFLCIRNATFLVSEAGRQRVLKDRKKNVHAFVSGDVSMFDDECTKPTTQVRYNPYEHETFVRADNMQPIYSAKRVHLFASGKVFADT